MISATLPDAWHRQQALCAPATDQFEMGSRHYAAGRWKLAIAEFRDYLEKSPTAADSAEARFYLAECLLQLDSLDDAGKAFSIFLDKHSEHRLARLATFRLGEIEYLQDDFADAKKHLEHFVKECSTAPLASQKAEGEDVALATPQATALMYLADIAASGNNTAQAIDLYEQSLEFESPAEISTRCHFRAADLHSSLKQFAKAEMHWQQVAQSSSLLSNDARLRLATLYVRQKQFNKALENLSNVSATRDDVGAHVGFWTGCAFSGLKQHDEAAEIWESTAVAYPQHGLAGRMMHDAAKQWQAAGEFERAELAWNRVVQFWPASEYCDDALLELAQAQQKAGDDQGALASYCELLKLPPGDHTVSAEFAAARLLEKLHRPAEAAELLEKIANENPGFIDHDAVLYLWAWILVDLHRGQQADQVFQRLYSAHPNSQYWPDATYRLAQRAADTKDHILAGQLLDQLLAEHRNPDVLEHALYLKGQIAAQKKDWHETTRAMQQLVDEYPGSPLQLHAEYWLAESAYRQARHEEAELRFAQLAHETASSQEPWVGMVVLRQAQQLARKQQWEDALDVADRISTRFPEFAQQFEVDYLRGRCFMGQARFDEARGAFQQVLKSEQAAGETAAMAQWMIGETYLHQKNYDEALRAYHRVELKHKFPRWQAAGALQIGKCLEAKGNGKEAATAYARAAEQYGSSSFADEARRRLKGVGGKTDRTTTSQPR